MRFGKLKVIKFNGYQENINAKRRMWLCKCDCGNEKIIRGSHLTTGKIVSCGCYGKSLIGINSKKYNTYDLTGEYGIGYTSNTNHEFYFDLEDYDKIKDYCWRQDIDHVIAPISNSLTTIGIHRVIMNCNNNELVVDHINGDGFNNQKNNLRVCTQLLNSFNHKVNSVNTSGTTGVSYHKKNMKWRAYITVRDKQINLGSYNKLDDAIIVRKQAEEKYFGDYARQA